MKKVLKWLGILLLVIIIAIGGGLLYITKALPDVGDAPDITVELTPDRIQRGDYLANCVTVCMDCHSTRDWSQFAGPLVPGTEGIGGEPFDRTMGFPGDFYARNISPTGIGSWTDGELYRTITTGVDREGEPLFPVMPYHYYGRMAKEDIYAIIAYLRTLPAQQNNIPERKIEPPFQFIMRMIPAKANPVEMPDPANTVAYGGYLVNAAACRECHTKEKDGQIIPEFEYAGGRVFEMPGGTLVSPNITPHETGLGSWSKERFVARFKNYQDSSYISPKIDFSKEYNTIMPWMMYSKMTEEDLGAIFEYLQTLKPMENSTTKWVARK